MAMIEVKPKPDPTLKLVFAGFMTFGILLLITIISLGSILVYLTYQNEEKNVCNSKYCVKAANMILNNMDETADPCDNFYQFSCGSFVKEKRIPDDQSKIDEFFMLRDKVAYSIADLLAEPVAVNESESVANAKRLYASCVDEASIEERSLADILALINKEFGGWPILKEGPFRKNRQALLETMISLRKLDSPQFFEVAVSYNPKNPRRFILRVTQPSWFFNKVYFYDEKVMQAYQSLMQTIIQSINSDSRNINDEIDRIFQLEKKFGTLQVDTDNNRNLTYQNITLKELEKLIPEFDWKKYTQGIFSEIENLNITDDEVVLIEDIKYLSEAAKLYSKSNIKDLNNLLIWLFVRESIPFLPKYFQDVKLEFSKVYDGTHVRQPRSIFCANFVNTKMEFAVGRLYVSRHFNSSSKHEAERMIDNLLNEFEIILKESDWMDDESKKKALEKVKQMDKKIGYSEDIFNETYLQVFYQNFVFDETQLMPNLNKLYKYSTKFALALLRKEQESKDWISGPAVVNAFYSPIFNQICFPAAILQPPFYDASNPKYLNYGGIGSVIGHEITHGFDDQGRMYDKDGVFYLDEESGALWTKNTIENYKKKAECIVNQYGSYEAKQVNRQLNGVNTQGENIADNGGLKESLRAYRKWVKQNSVSEPLLPGLEKYSQEQLFFINFGQLWCGKVRDQALVQEILNDSHSPGEFRIIGPTSNSIEFAQAFKCHAGQNNNPEKKCSVW